MNLIAGLLQGMGARQKEDKDREKDKQLFDLQKQNAGLQQLQLKMNLEKQKMQQTIMNAFLQEHQEKKAEKASAPYPNPSTPGIFNSGQVGGEFNKRVDQVKSGVTDKLAEMSPAIQAIMKSLSGIDFVGAGKSIETQRHNAELEDAANRRASIAESNLEERRRHNKFLEGQPNLIDVTLPGGGKVKQAVPKDMPIGSVIPTTPGARSMPIAEANLPLWVNLEDMSTPPIGTTPEMAAKQGYKRITANQKSVITSMGSVENILSEVEGMMGNVFPKTESMFGRMLNAPKRKLGAMFQTNEQAAEYQSFVSGTVAPVIRGLGEKGALADKDVERAINLFPKLTDDADVAWSKLERLRGIFAKAKEQQLGSVGAAPDMIYNPATGKLEPAK